jgi:hypothetical protein
MPAVRNVDGISPTGKSKALEKRVENVSMRPPFLSGRNCRAAALLAIG